MSLVQGMQAIAKHRRALKPASRLPGVEGWRQEGRRDGVCCCWIVEGRKVGELAGSVQQLFQNLSLTLTLR